MSDSIETRLNLITDASELGKLNNQLTQSMKQQQIQALIRNENLGRVIDAIMRLATREPDKHMLYGAAMLGRLAAVARGRESEVYSRAPQLFTYEPPSIESLSDGDEKEYAAKMLAYADAEWLVPYCARESLTIDTANNARKELLRILLNKKGDVASSIRMLTESQVVFKEITQVETHIKRVRRIMEAFSEVVRNYEGDVGQEPGSALEKLFVDFVRGATKADIDAMHAILEAAIGILVRIIELRFSHALHSETYHLLQTGKRLLPHNTWIRFTESSSMIRKVQMNLLETSLVLARQNRTDKEILRAMEASWPSTYSVTTAIRNHFEKAVDIDPGISDYWLKLGRVSESERVVEHKLGNTEDQQIGELLIQLDANRDNMNKLNRAVVPVLETFDPIQAATVRRAANGYESIAQIAERLARMRKLSKTDLLANVVDYNPIEHDMEGGHRSGIRKVRIVRDGILKVFGGKPKTLVKARVEPEE